MARYIDAEKIKYWIRYVSSNGLNSDVRRVAFFDEIERMPTADVVPRKENDVPRYIKLPQPEYLPPTAEELEAFAAKLYQSPIEIIMQEMQTQFDGEVFKATQAYGINIDKDELIKALQYDRDQYDKGFADGSRLNTDAIRAEVAREICCKIEEEIVAALESNYRAMREHNLKRCPGSDGLFLERIYGKIDALRGIEGFVEEIKEKYAEGKK